MEMDFVSSSDNPPIMCLASSSGGAAPDDSFEDACSICLEPFDTDDPATVTNCKHEYHLQCILEWSQRSKECPICWQLLVLKDPASQELLTAVARERSSRFRCNNHLIHEDNEIDHDAPYMDDSEFNEHIMRHFAAAAASRARCDNRRRRQRSSGIGPSQVLPSVPTADVPSVQQMHSSPEECPNSGYGLLEVDSPTSSTQSTINDQTPSSVVPPVVNVVSSTVGNRDGPLKPRVPYSQTPPDISPRSTSSELLAFSESVKSRLSAASARYKESISKGTRGLKEKLLARNNSVKELSKGVQREMSAGVARMIERLDLNSKRTGVSVPLSNCAGETSNFPYKGKDEAKDVQENVMAQSLHGNTGESAHDMRSDAPPYVSNTIPC